MSNNTKTNKSINQNCKQKFKEERNFSDQRNKPVWPYIITRHPNQDWRCKYYPITKYNCWKTLTNPFCNQQRCSKYQKYNSKLIVGKSFPDPANKSHKKLFRIKPINQ